MNASIVPPAASRMIYQRDMVNVQGSALLSRWPAADIVEGDRPRIQREKAHNYKEKE